ncbi:hypothetical protein BDY21DRAFT_282588 [Lineolata rhizophorae]|uniref:Uncharacterized protein n=1 Tax=Lineolata rhizophorae TaxID=578093 RepID=A0A6A6P5X6_9PEZI|nr:hypothetical protein BDY21DRAFT_282588 [Lineolata rhizophorae]
MNGYYSRHFSADEFEQLDQANDDSNMMGMIGAGGMQSTGIMSGQSLDDIVNQNSKAMRRRSVPAQYSSTLSPMNTDMRRMSMMEFGGTSSATPLDGFQFDSQESQGMEGMMPTGTAMDNSGEGLQQRRQSGSNIALNTQFSAQSSPFTTVAPPESSFATPLQSANQMDLDMSNPYLNNAVGMGMDMNDPSLSSIMGNDMNSLNMFNPPQFGSPMVNSPIQQDFSQPLSAGPRDLQAAALDQTSTLSAQNTHTSNGKASQPGVVGPELGMQTEPSAQAMVNSVRSAQVDDAPSAFGPLPPPQAEPGFTVGPNGQKLPWVTPPEGFPSTMNARPHMNTEFKNAYSATGFDMLGVLMRVASRPNPEIDIGSVDLSCAFVVCDAEKDDVPIVYCSEVFERLTGYTRHEILGRNCRFLQSPDGNVQPGLRRKYVDDDAVLYLKNSIMQRRESQISLINYRKGGQPFMNLLTMIPISWDGSAGVKFFVGFQVDLVEQPHSMKNKNPGTDGSFSMNYQRAISLPKYSLKVPDMSNQSDFGQTVPRDKVAQVLTSLGTAEVDLTKRMGDKVLLENTDDVVHVLSLKGLFLYLSPSCRKVLEYDASELVGTALSSVCHPSDIVPVTRELKDSSSKMPVNIVFRILRKHSGYMWFEGHGSLHTEQGKGRKCIILVGRERPVYALNKNDLLNAGGIGDNELWTKMSTSGMFLYVSSNVRSLLDRQPDDLIGTSIQQLMRTDTRAEFGRILEFARVGRKASTKHEMINRRGQVLQAFTTIYPGDATEGQKPTFLVAQTRLLKFSRGSSTSVQRPQSYGKQDNASSVVSKNSNVPSGSLSIAGNSTPQSMISGTNFISTEGQAATYSGASGLPIGKQDESLASEENVFDELKTTRSSSWQYELRQMEKRNRVLAEEVQSLLAARKKRKRRKGAGQLQKDCANCHTRVTPEWRRGPSGNRDLCNSCGLRWAKQNGRVSPRTQSQPSVNSAESGKGSKHSASPIHSQHVRNASEVLGSSTAANKAAAGANPSSPDAVKTHTMSDMHTAKASKTEHGAHAAATSGVPEKIDEGVEPD